MPGEMRQILVVIEAQPGIWSFRQVRRSNKLTYFLDSNPQIADCPVIGLLEDRNNSIHRITEKDLVLSGAEAPLAKLRAKDTENRARARPEYLPQPVP